jgi:hypothetical protein
MFEAPSLQGYLLHLHNKMCSTPLVLMILKTVVSGCLFSGWKLSGLQASSRYLFSIYRTTEESVTITRAETKSFLIFFFLDPVSHFSVRCQQITFSSTLLHGQKFFYIYTHTCFLFGTTIYLNNICGKHHTVRGALVLISVI